MMLVRILALGTVLGTATISSSAQQGSFDTILHAMRGTISVSSQPILTEGRLTGCTLVFDAIYQDWSYRGGDFLKVTGNVGIVAYNQNIGTNLKVVVHEIDLTGTQPTFTPSPPSRAYLVDDALSTNLDSLVQASASDTPGALFSVFQMSPTFEMILAALESNTLTVAFNSNGGGIDMQLPLELDVVDISETGKRARSEGAKDNFLACAQKLLGQLEQ